MGQKVRPTGFRTGIMSTGGATWYANKQDFAELLVEDFKIRKFVKKQLRAKRPRHRQDPHRADPREGDRLHLTRPRSA